MYFINTSSASQVNTCFDDGGHFLWIPAIKLLDALQPEEIQVIIVHWNGKLIKVYSVIFLFLIKQTCQTVKNKFQMNFFLGISEQVS